MKTNDDAIRRALRQAPPPPLPEGFTLRLMERVRRKARRRERIETALLLAGGIALFGALIAASLRRLAPRMAPRVARAREPAPHRTARHSPPGTAGRGASAAARHDPHRRALPRPAPARPADPPPDQYPDRRTERRPHLSRPQDSSGRLPHREPPAAGYKPRTRNHLRACGAGASCALGSAFTLSEASPSTIVRSSFFEAS